jgi:hypothetical protein
MAWIRLPIGGLLICFAYLSPFSSYLHVISSTATEAPLAEKNIFNKSSTPAAYWWSIDIYRLSPFSTYLRLFDSAAKQAPPSGENIFNRKPDPSFLFVIC